MQIYKIFIFIQIKYVFNLKVAKFKINANKKGAHILCTLVKKIIALFFSDIRFYIIIRELLKNQSHIYQAVIANGFKLNLYSFGLHLNFSLKILEK